ncbi:MAG: DUF3592 domain-containing protein [Pseudomonadota bacterium]
MWRLPGSDTFWRKRGAGTSLGNPMSGDHRTDRVAGGLGGQRVVHLGMERMAMGPESPCCHGLQAVRRIALRYKFKARLFNVPYPMVLTLLLGVLFLGMSAWVLIVRMPVQEALDARGVTTVAVVEATRNYRNHRPTTSGRTELVTYRFETADGQVLTPTLRKSYDYRRPVKVGREIEVTYLPDRPEAHFTSLRPVYTRKEVAYLLLPMALVAFGLGLYYARQLPRDWEGPKLWPPIRLG